MHRYTYIYIDIHIYIDILTYTYIYIHMHAHAGRKQAAFRNTHTYTYIHTVAISSHSFVAAQLGFAGIGRCCHGVAMALSRNIVVVRCRGKRAGYRAYVGGKYHSYHKTQVLAKAAIKHAINIAKNGLGSTPRPKTKAKAKNRQTGAFKESTTFRPCSKLFQKRPK